MDDRQKKLLDYITANPKADTQQIKKALDMKENAVKYNLMELQKEGVIQWR